MVGRVGGPSRSPIAWACTLLSLLVCRQVAAFESRPLPLVLPLDSRSQLSVQREGVDLLNSIPGPVSPVVIIGPYRSGKSFTLNQLLGLPCNQGFGVGHTRTTETKGIWLWGKPVLRRGAGAGAAGAGAGLEGGGAGAGQLQPQDEAGGGDGTVLLYVDTEGFESTGKANSYDDRIFALSAMMSSLLIYNLPETIRESDVAKLSFAVELARGFYDRSEQANTSDSGGWEVDDGSGDITKSRSGDGGVEPGSMLWLIQRDFLHGQTADQLVKSVLAPVDNPKHDTGLEALNQVRASLSVLARNSTGFSLRQPHIDRARLCEIPDEQLDPTYIRQREELKELVKSLAQPRALHGQPLTGPQLASLISRMVEALNEQEIPTATSLLAAFNRDVLTRCAANYTAALADIRLPVEEYQLEAVELEARGAALEMLKALQIGRQGAIDTRTELVKELERAYQVRRTENLAASNALCSELENKCEAELDELQNMRLPSLRKFESSYQHCEKVFTEQCRGPAKAPNAERLEKAGTRARKAFGKDYNDRLFTGLLVTALAAAVVFRFFLRSQLLEMASWAAFLFLEIYPKLNPVTSMYDTRGWALTVRMWEVCMAVLFAFNGSVFVWLALVVVLAVIRMCYSRRRRRGAPSSGWGRGGDGSGNGGGGNGGGGGVLLGMGSGGGGGGGGTRRKQISTKDLDV
ncbi:hypothetical protein Vafri_6610 [Volvox africanus]|uniref:GB1/RHD3-type G domain-containing protein n=1 Tax=Volvox africanus TaxID=51714 RepID=A0A8J4EY91_9CHLO|nr:hypothetical protein Vafri_6610 [Volvox africanus]